MLFLYVIDDARNEMDDAVELLKAHAARIEVNFKADIANHFLVCQEITLRSIILVGIIWRLNILAVQIVIFLEPHLDVDFIIRYGYDAVHIRIYGIIYVIHHSVCQFTIFQKLFSLISRWGD